MLHPNRVGQRLYFQSLEQNKLQKDAFLKVQGVRSDE
jgi:hypothetical protein